ncbi:MAG TPA: succinylglutamate desuccinylase [Paucimonas sp.]|nr:succinylglutamate desuccinylase [Paucimonas sp.]
MSDAVRALAEADFGGIAERFSSAGFGVEQPARGILQIKSSVSLPERLALLVSVGVHGDETAPIEMLALLLDRLAQAPQALAVDLMVAVGNLGAIAQGKRYLDADMNRMFRAERGDLANAAEASRADEIMAAVAAFFAASPGRKWHLDLHTAIRPSVYPAFAVIPDVIAEEEREALLAWLGGAGIDAVILNRKLAGTFSAWTALEFGASGTTVELGRIGELGANDLSQFAATQAALDALLRSGDTRPLAQKTPRVFVVAQEIVKRSDAFTMAFDKATWNFTALEPGAEIARDGDIVYRVGAETEYVVFPNPDVRPGLRAGLMVVRRP